MYPSSLYVRTCIGTTLRPKDGHVHIRCMSTGTLKGFKVWCGSLQIQSHLVLPGLRKPCGIGLEFGACMLFGFRA